jgi:hypothetical protein
MKNYTPNECKFQTVQAQQLCSEIPPPVKREQHQVPIFQIRILKADKTEKVQIPEKQVTLETSGEDLKLHSKRV